MEIIKKNSIEAREFYSVIQNPEWCFDSIMERQIYYLFRENYLLPQLQYKVGSYFLDFAFSDMKIGIEYDGKHHKDQYDRDIKRDRYLNSLGWEIGRIYKNDKGFDVRFGDDPIGQSESLELTIEIFSELVKQVRLKEVPHPFFH